MGTTARNISPKRRNNDSHQSWLLILYHPISPGFSFTFLSVLHDLCHIIDDVKDLETKERFLELRANGMSYEKISQELQVSKQTLVTWSKDLTTAIANLRSIRLEALIERYCAAKEHRLKVFGDALSRIHNELTTRDLSQVSTDRLIDLALKVGASLRNEEADVVFKGAESPFTADFDEREVEWRA